MKNGLLFLLFLLASGVALAQSKVSRLGRFEMDQVHGCVPFTVNIVRTDLVTTPIALKCDASTPCFIDYGDGTGGQTNAFTHTYSQPGTYKLSVLYQGADFDDIQIVVYPNIQPTFNIYRCSGNEIQVQVTDTNYDNYIINYNDATAEVEIPKGSSPVAHTFSSSGAKTVSVRGKNTGAADNCIPPQTKNVTVTTAAPPVPSINTLSITSSSVIDLLFTTQQNVLYRLEIAVNGGVFQNLGNLFEVNTATVPGLDTDNNFYCFRLGTVNPCSGGVFFSSVICSSDLAVTPQNNANALAWTTSTTGVVNFTINRDGTLLTTTTATSFSDPNVTCGTEYCYQIIANYTAATATSTTRCVTAISTDIPTAISNVSSVVNGSSVAITWLEDPTFEEESYTVFRKPAGGAYSSIQDGITVTTYTDNNYSTSSNYCYRIDYVDVCSNASTSGIEACPIVLGYDTNADNDIVLTWSSYPGWITGVNRYELDKYDLQHTLLETIMVGTAVTYTDTDMNDQGYYYVVRAIPNDGANTESVSNEINALRKLRFAYPKAFTPDKQGPTENETFKVFVTEEFIASFDMKIFNRWGEMIFSTTDLSKGWDGKFNGSEQPEGTYTFTATLRDKTGKTYKRDGSVMLLRKK